MTNLLPIFLLFSTPAFADWTPVDWRTFAPALPDDPIQVLYLVSPLLEEDFGKWLGYAHAYHAAIAFINLNTGFNITINYDADDFFRATLFPVINTTSKELTFENQGGLFIYMGINSTYWEKEMTVVGQINGTVWNNFMTGFDATLNASQPYYNLFEVVSRGGIEFVPGWTCFDFFWASLWELHEAGVDFSPNLTLYSNFANIYTKSQPVDITAAYYNDPEVHERVFQFYELIEVKFRKLGFLKLIEEIFSLFGGKFYLRASNTFYEIDLEFPYLDLLWKPRPIPGQS